MQNTSLDQSYYGKQVGAQQILNGNVINQGADKLTAALPA
jgi:lipid-binding SYLF domain-containing protein